MKRIAMAIVICLIAVLAIEDTARAGYTYNSSTGYYYDAAGNAYTRSWYTYWRGCCKYGAYRYTLVKKTIDYTKDGWREQIVEALKERQRYDGKAKIAAIEHAAFMETIKELGMSGALSTSQYNVRYPDGFFGAGGYQQQQQYYGLGAQQGNTLYGYTKQAVTYDPVDIGAIFNQASRLAENAQTLADTGTNNFQRMASDVAAGAQKIAQIEATAKLTQAILNSGNPTTITTQQFSSTPADPNGDGQPYAALASDANALAAVLQKHGCVACHDAEKPKGEWFRAADVLQYDADKWSVILARVSDPDPSKRMPPADSGHPPVDVASSAVLHGHYQNLLSAIRKQE